MQKNGNFSKFFQALPQLLAFSYNYLAEDSPSKNRIFFSMAAKSIRDVDKMKDTSGLLFSCANSFPCLKISYNEVSMSISNPALCSALQIRLFNYLHAADEALVNGYELHCTQHMK